MNSIAKLQGTPWHYEQARKTCQDGSKYCVYNHNICSNKYCKNYHKKCLGKSRCELFEPKTGTPKIYSERTYIDKDKQIKANPNKIKEQKGMTKSEKTNKVNEPVDKHQKFIETCEKRVNDIVIKIENLENLSNKNAYEYTNEEVEKMFDKIQDTLNNAKMSFESQKKIRFKF